MGVWWAECAGVANGRILRFWLHTSIVQSVIHLLLSQQWVSESFCPAYSRSWEELGNVLSNSRGKQNDDALVKTFGQSSGIVWNLSGVLPSHSMVVYAVLNCRWGLSYGSSDPCSYCVILIATCLLESSTKVFHGTRQWPFYMQCDWQNVRKMELLVTSVRGNLIAHLYTLVTKHNLRLHISKPDVCLSSFLLSVLIMQPQQQYLSIVKNGKESCPCIFTCQLKPVFLQIHDFRLETWWRWVLTH